MCIRDRIRLVSALKFLPVFLLSVSIYAASPIDDEELSPFTLPGDYEAVVCPGNEDGCDSPDTADGTSQPSNAPPIIASALTAGPMQQALETLAQHLDGSNVLTTSELDDLGDTIDEFSESLSGNADLVEKAYDVIQSHESVNGALFTANGTQSFSRNDSDTDGRALERTMHSVYLSVFDAIDSSLIASDRSLIDGLEFGSADYFLSLIHI